ncbi:MAG: glycoside hydrolase family 97 protein [Muribaculaceae bacterium]|nr:glycoside hydrolase family 97 protein [Muribaculaceae bacterium]
MDSMIRTISLCAVLLGGVASIHADILSLSSPDGRKTVRFEKPGKELTYSVMVDGKDVILPSRAGLEVDNRTWEMALGKRDLAQPASWMDPLTVDSVSIGVSVDTVWTPLYGERSKVRDRYNQATLHMSRKDKSDYRLDVQVRAYDEGIAFRYFFPEHPAAIFHKVVDDLTDFTLPSGTMAWSEEWAQAPFMHQPIDSISIPVERALTMELPNGQWVAILDADNDDWCLTKLKHREGHGDTLESVMYSPVDIVTYYATPWKIIMTADSPTQLLENNDIVNNLNPPAKGDFSWVIPGKIMRCTTLTTEAGMKNIDFCAEHNIPYMLFDWLWYVPCTSHDGDATKVIDKLDMQKIVEYGKEKGVGIWLYVNQHALMKQMDELFPLLKEWGIVGVKSGFVQYASHRWATWLHDMVRKAADNRLMMNIHDEYRPSGFSRTYPNLLTQEGIHGNEEWPDATHNVTLPFTRMLNGAADYTICYFDQRLKNTHAHQLAASLIFYSPLQTILWYDTPERYHGEPEIEWFENLETTFDDTKVLSGYPGRDIVMARRKGDTWFLAAMTGNDARREEIPLDFLPEGTMWLAQVYTDDPTVDTATKVRCESYAVTPSTVMKFDLQSKGGAAVRMTPLADKKEIKKYKKYK